MSAYGYKQTSEVHATMSAVPPEADIEGAKANVSFLTHNGHFLLMWGSLILRGRRFREKKPNAREDHALVLPL